MYKRQLAARRRPVSWSGCSSGHSTAISIAGHAAISASSHGSTPGSRSCLAVAGRPGRAFSSGHTAAGRKAFSPGRHRVTCRFLCENPGIADLLFQFLLDLGFPQLALLILRCV